jgi:hypothetical protein
MESLLRSHLTSYERYNSYTAQVRRYTASLNKGGATGRAVDYTPGLYVLVLFIPIVASPLTFSSCAY